MSMTIKSNLLGSEQCKARPRYQTNYGPHNGPIFVAGYEYWRLVYRFDFTWPPAFLDPGFAGAGHTQDDEPALAGDCLQPVVLVALRRCRREIDIV